MSLENKFHVNPKNMALVGYNLHTPKNTPDMRVNQISWFHIKKLSKKMSKSFLKSQFDLFV